MKRFFNYAAYLMMGAVMTLSFTSCGDDDEKNTGNTTDNTQTTDDTKNKAMASLTKQYVENVVFTTYTSLADATESLHDELTAATEKFNKGTLTQDDIDNLCETFLAARKYWEESEAFLYGAATDFGIDPHIDTWPLDVKKLATVLSNSETMARVADEDLGELGEQLLGFHGIEFIIFRDGHNRTVEALQANETDAAFAGKSVNGAQELVYAAAVANDLYVKCCQLEVAWKGEKASKDHIDAVEEAELPTTVASTDNLYYGDNLINACTAGSTYKAWRNVLNTILVSGCSNICNEVASQKIGQAWNGEDPNYIESPYSKKSFQDFYDNITSIKNTLYGNIDADAPNANSIIAYLMTFNSDMGTSLNDKVEKALTALDACRKGTAFVDIIQSGQKPATVKTAIDNIEALDNALKEASQWIAAN